MCQGALWRSEDSSVEPVLAFYLKVVDPGIELRSLGLYRKHLSPLKHLTDFDHISHTSI